MSRLTTTRSSVIQLTFEFQKKKDATQEAINKGKPLIVLARVAKKMNVSYDEIKPYLLEANQTAQSKQ